MASMGGWLKRVVAPEVQEIFKRRVPGRLGVRGGVSLLKPFGTDQTPDGRRQRHLAGQARRLRAMTAVLPPPSGKRRPEFCGADDIFWTTADGDITSQLVKPRRSLWTPFQSWAPGRKITAN